MAPLTLTRKNIGLMAGVWFMLMISLAVMVSKASDLKQKMWLLKIQIVLFMESLLFLGNYIIWKAAHKMFPNSKESCRSGGLTRLDSDADVSLRKKKDVKSGKDQSQTQNIENSPKMLNQKLSIKLFYFILLIQMILSQMAPITNVFYLMGTDPYWFTVLCYICMGIELQCITGLGLINGLSLSIKYMEKKKSHKPQHSFSHLLQKIKFHLLICYVMFVSILGIYNASTLPLVKQVSVPIKDLPSNLQNLHIVQLSDIHLGPTVGYSRLKAIIDLVDQENPGEIHKIFGNDYSHLWWE